MNLISKIQLRAKIVKNYLDKIASMVIRDPFFKNVVLLLHGNGDNTGQNNTFIDNSANNFTITRNGNVAQGTFAPYGDDWSNYFDGTGDDLSLTGQSLAATDWTVECWVNFSSFSNNGPHIWNFGLDGTNRYNVWRNSSSGKFSFARVNGGSFDIKDGTTTPVVGRWYHVAVVRVNSTGVQTLYIDGVAEVTNTGPISTGTTWTIGFVPSGGVADRMLGYISNLRVVTSALYTANFTPPTTPLTAITNTSLLTCSSNRFRDVSSNNRAITRNGDVAVSSFSPFELTTAYLPTTTSQSVYFDGTGDYLRVSYTSAFDLSSGDFTIEGWFNSNSFAAPFNVIAKDTAGTNFDWAILITNNTTIVWYTAGTAQNLTATVPAMSVGTWYHVAYVRSSGVNRIYLNGISYAENTMSITNASQVAVTIGCNGQNSPQNFINGYISNLRIVKGTAVYTSNFTPSRVPLVSIANTSLLTCQSNRFVDASTNNFTITPNGNAAIQLLNPFFPTSQLGIYGGSGYFDGSGDELSFPVSTAFELGTGDFTFEVWLYPNSLALNNSAFVLDSSSYPIIMLLRDGTSFKVLASTNGTGWQIEHTAAIVVRQWNHVVFQRNGNAFRTFLNGSLVGTTTISLTFGGQRSVGYVGRGDGTSQRWDGLISDVRLVKGTAVYNTSGFTPPTAPLTAVTNTSLLLNFQNAEIIDNAMMNNLETVGNAQISTSVTKYGSGSLAFDGTGDWLLAPNSSTLTLAGDFTIEAWIYVTAGGANRGIITIGDRNTANGLSLYWQSSTAIIAISNGTQIVGTGAVLGLNTWAHIALTRSGTGTNNLKIYVNGVMSAQNGVGNTTIFSGAAVNGVCVGVSYASGFVEPFQGYIDDVRITNGVARYTGTSSFTPPENQFPDL